jgi:hypothetical protein
VISVLVVMLTDMRVFPFLHAIMFALTLCAILGTSLKRSTSVLAAALVVALMPVIVMVSTKHPLPLGDDARFIGFAAAINSDGKWVSFKYPENPYYQFFPPHPCIRIHSSLHNRRQHREPHRHNEWLFNTQINPLSSILPFPSLSHKEALTSRSAVRTTVRRFIKGDAYVLPFRS